MIFSLRKNKSGGSTEGRQIILCATQRCGSTLIVEDMRNSERLGKPEEYFLPWAPDQEGQNWDKRLETLQRAGTSENGVFSVKVMADHLRRADLCLAQRPSLQGADIDTSGVFPHFHHSFRDASFVWIRRGDTLRQAISRLIAKQTGVTHAVAKEDDEHFAGRLLKGYSEDYNSGIVFNRATLNIFINQIVRENMIWQRFFQDWGIEPLVLVYEDFKDDFPGYLHRIAESIDVTLPKDLPARKMVKLSNQRNEDWMREFTDALIEDLPTTPPR